MSFFSRSNLKIAKLLEYSETLKDLSSVSGLLSWDQETYLPSKGALARAHQIETMAGILYSHSTAKALGDLLAGLTEDVQLSPQEFTDHDKALIRLMARDYALAKKLSKKLVQELSKHCSLSLEVWKHARAQNSFAPFAKSLDRMVELKREVAYAYGYVGSPYDALLEEYEEGLRTKTVTHVFSELTQALTPLIQTLVRKTAHWDRKVFHQSYDEQKLWAVTVQILEELGFDLESGRQDQSTHPFTMSLDASDVRLTTRVLSTQPLSTILSSIHEGGHGMYEQGIAPEITRTRLGVADSLVIHESQSRFFENMIGKSEQFWEHFFPKLQATFPQQLSATTAKQAWEEANIIRPSLIRVDADEVTYHMHIAVRFEIERDLIEGKIRAEDVPEVWKTLYASYLGIEVSDDLHGALQDIHWSQGLIGYFPTYSLGSFLSVQIADAIMRAHPDFHDRIQRGEFHWIRTWLADQIHRYGRLYSSDEVSTRVTGMSLSSTSFINYITKKFSL